MATRKDKKNKKKFLKMKQKEITLKNKQNKVNKTELLDIDKDEIPDIEEMIEYTGLRNFLLKFLRNTIHSLNSKDLSDEDIITAARYMMAFANNPEKTYNEILNPLLKKYNIKKMKRLNNKNSKLNTTERVLLRQMMSGILQEYAMIDINLSNIDYGGIRVFFEMTYRLISVGLEEKKIDRIRIDVGYGDCIHNIVVNYKDDNSKYNMKENSFIFIRWNTLDNLYNTYTIYKNKYKNFSEGSLNMLATASAIKEDYHSNYDGKEIISYNGLLNNYLNVFEHELKKLISNKFGLDEKKLKLVDAINYLEKIDNQILSNPNIIKNLHKVRKIRNYAFHGHNISYDDYKYVEDTLTKSNIELEVLIDGKIPSNKIITIDIFEEISHELCYL